MTAEPSPSHWPVSCKGVVLASGRVLLAANDRGQWELPGGRLEIDESPQRCVAREVAEESGLTVEVGEIIDSWVYEPTPGHRVLIVTYGCRLLDPDPRIVASDEHREVRFVPIDEIGRLALPDGYRASIVAWQTRS